MQPVVNIYAKGGTQNEMPFFSNKKIIVIRLSVVRSAVLCFLESLISTRFIQWRKHFNSCYSLLTSPIKVLALKNLKFEIWNLYFAVNLVTSFSRQKTLNSKTEKQRIFLDYKVLPSCKVWAQTNKKYKRSFYLVIFCDLYAHRGYKREKGRFPFSQNFGNFWFGGKWNTLRFGSSHW